MVDIPQMTGMLSSLWAKLRTAQGALLLLLAFFFVYVGFSGLPSLESLNALFNTSLAGSPTGAVVLAPLNGNASSQGNQSGGSNQTSNISGGSGLTALLSGTADLAVTSVSFSPSSPIEGDTVSITAKVSNLGDASALVDDVTVTFSAAGSVSSKSIDLTGKPEVDVSFTWTAVKGSHEMAVSADPLGVIPDKDKANNKMAKGINVSSRNNAPVLQPIAPISVNAGDRAIITANASDPDNDALTYFVNDSRFAQSGSSFAWRTSEYDVGRHMALVSVSDGRLTDTTSVQIIVNSVSGGGGRSVQSVQVSTVDGYVYDNSASLIPGANVTGTCLSNSNTFSAVTNSGGRYSAVFNCPFNTTINVSASKSNYTGYSSGASDGTGHASIDIVIPFTNIEIPEFPTAAVPALLSLASFGILRRRKR